MNVLKGWFFSPFFLWVALILIVALIYIYIKKLKRDYYNLMKDNYNSKRKYEILNNLLRYEYRFGGLSRYFYVREIKTVAIWGMGDIGNRVLDILDHDGVEVKYVIENGIGFSEMRDITIFNYKNKLPCVDLVIASFAYNIDTKQRFCVDHPDIKMIFIEEILENG